MATRTSEAEWKGNLLQGSGWVKSGSGALEGKYSFSSRFEEGPGTNPEELIAAAHAGCFSMALAGELGKAGFKPESIHTEAKVTVEKTEDGFTITKIHLETRVCVPGVDNDTFQKIAGGAKTGCPVSRALAAVPSITLNAELV